MGKFAPLRIRKNLIFNFQFGKTWFFFDDFFRILEKFLTSFGQLKSCFWSFYLKEKIYFKI